MHSFHVNKKLVDLNTNLTESINYWKDKTNYFSKSFALSVFLSSSPILIGLLIMFIISRSLNVIQYYRAKKARIKRQEKWKKFERLYEESAENLEKKDKIILNNVGINIQNMNHEDPVQKNFSSNIKRKIAHAYGLSELFIPDENKVPIVLLNEAWAKLSNIDLAQTSKLVADDDSDNRNIRFDPKLVDVINELVHPKFSLTDEEGSEVTSSNTDDKSKKSFVNPISKIANTFKELIKSDDEKQERRNSNDKYESSAFESSDERKYSKGRRKSTNMKKKKRINYQTTYETDDENLSKINNKNNMSPTSLNENLNNQNSKSSETKFEDIETTSSKNNNIMIVVEDYDEINNRTITKNDETYRQMISAVNDNDKQVGHSNEGYEEV